MIHASFLGFFYKDWFHGYSFPIIQATLGGESVRGHSWLCFHLML